MMGGTEQHQKAVQTLLDDPNRTRIPVRKVLATAYQTITNHEKADKRDIFNGGTVSPESKKWANEQNPYPPPTPFDAACDRDFEIDGYKQKLESLRSEAAEVEECISNLYSNATNMQSSKSTKKSKKSKKANGTAPGSQYSNGTAIGTQPSYAGTDVWNK